MSLIKPPLHPSCFPDELPYGYLKRLAELNQYDSPAWLFRELSSPSRLQNPMFSSAQLSSANWAGGGETPSSVFSNTRYLRFCPLCIMENGYWKSSWQSWVSCACTRHQIWLVDRCPSCFITLPLKSTELLNCACGTRLADAAKEIIDIPVERMQAFLDEGVIPPDHPLLPCTHGLDYSIRASFISFLCTWLDYPNLTPQRFNRELMRCNTARIHFVNAADILFQQDGLEVFLFRLSQRDNPEHYSSHILRFVLRLNISFPEPCFQVLKREAMNYWVQMRSALDMEQGRSSDISDLWEYAEWQVLPHDPK